MVRNAKPAILAALVVLSLLVGTVYLALGPSKVIAQAFDFLVENQGTRTVTATTTVTYMTAGTATTSAYYDSYASGQANTYGTDSATLAIQFTASSTSSNLLWFYEYAQSNTVDCVASPTACDWYADDQLAITNASTTGVTSLANTVQYRWTYASTSQGGAVIGASANNGLKMVSVPMPARYVRAVFTLPVGSTAGAVWAAFIGKKQTL